MLCHCQEGLLSLHFEGISFDIAPALSSLALVAPGNELLALYMRVNHVHEVTFLTCRIQASEGEWEMIGVTNNFQTIVIGKLQYEAV